MPVQVLEWPMVAKMFDTTVPVLPRTRSFLGLAHGINRGIKRTDAVDGLGKQPSELGRPSKLLFWLDAALVACPCSFLLVDTSCSTDVVSS